MEISHPSRQHILCFVKLHNFHLMIPSLVTRNPIPYQVNQCDSSIHLWYRFLTPSSPPTRWWWGHAASGREIKSDFLPAYLKEEFASWAEGQKECYGRQWTSLMQRLRFYHSLPWAGEPDQETDPLLWAGMCVCMDVGEIPKEQLGRGAVLSYKSCSFVRLFMYSCTLPYRCFILKKLDKKSRYHSSLMLSLGSCTSFLRFLIHWDCLSAITDTMVESLKTILYENDDVSSINNVTHIIQSADHFLKCFQNPRRPRLHGQAAHTFGSARALMTFPRASRDRLIFVPSTKRAPLALVALARSDPARSMRDILAIRMFWLMLAVLSCCRR